jgi:glycosyltransferase involved in cell wall biosynthesis
MSIKQKDETPVPLLLISDAPSCSSGLGRITRDLAIRIHAHLSDIFRVGVLGYGGPGSRKFGFQQYVIEGMSDWVIPTLPEVWQDFAGEERGIVLSIWDASRLVWFSQPGRCEMLNNYPILRNWLLNAPFDRWGYFPIDAEGPNGKLSFPLNQTLLGFDRILAYGQWARDVMKRSIGESNALQRNIDFLPHGIDADIFYQRDRTNCRFKFGSITGAQTLVKVPQLSSIMDNEILIGIIATNQARKDWALALETAAIVAKERKVRLWIHTDVLERNWSIPALLADYGLIDKTMISLEYLSDDKMAQAYSACDITLAPGAGEGFCFPLFESIACKTPCIHGNYGGAPEWMPPEFLVEPVAYRYEGLYSNKRPVFVAQDWANKVSAVLQNASHQQVHFNDALMWENLWPYWERWFREGWNG